jgi:CO/xanthine dehydrogenase FAD-binding subunit
MTIREYACPGTLAQAYDFLLQDRGNEIVAGLTMLKMSNRAIVKAIDLSALNLDYVREEDGFLKLGAMLTLRRLELSELCRDSFSGALIHAVEHVGGIQLRSHITIGGTVSSRIAYSDLITVLQAIGAEVALHRQGIVPLADFLEQPVVGKDIITEVRLPMRDTTCSLEGVRNSYLDYPLLNVSVAKCERDISIAVGARPRRAKLAKNAMVACAGGCSAREAGKIASEELDFGDDLRASAWYRKKICAVLVAKGLNNIS